MLMGASALVLVGILGVYFAAGKENRTFDILQIVQNVQMSPDAQKIFFPSRKYCSIKKPWKNRFAGRNYKKIQVLKRK